MEEKKYLLTIEETEGGINIREFEGLDGEMLLMTILALIRRSIKGKDVSERKFFKVLQVLYKSFDKQFEKKNLKGDNT